MLKQNLLIRFSRDERGVTALEFAFVAPVLLLFIFGILEFAMVFFAANTLESAVNNASRTGKTGYVENGISREQTLLNEITARASGLLDPEEISLTTTTYEDYDQIGQGEPYTDSNSNGMRDDGETFTDSNRNGRWDATLGEQGLGEAGEVVVYQISYPWRLMTPLIGNIIGTDGVLTLSTRVVVKNEPYSDSEL